MQINDHNKATADKLTPFKQEKCKSHMSQIVTLCVQVKNNPYAFIDIPLRPQKGQNYKIHSQRIENELISGMLRTIPKSVKNHVGVLWLIQTWGCQWARVSVKKRDVRILLCSTQMQQPVCVSQRGVLQTDNISLAFQMFCSDSVQRYLRESMFLGSAPESGVMESCLCCRCCCCCIRPPPAKSEYSSNDHRVEWFEELYVPWIGTTFSLNLLCCES